MMMITTKSTFFPLLFRQTKQIFIYINTNRVLYTYSFMELTTHQKKKPFRLANTTKTTTTTKKKRVYKNVIKQNISYNNDTKNCLKTSLEIP